MVTSKITAIFTSYEADRQQTCHYGVHTQKLKLNLSILEISELATTATQKDTAPHLWLDWWLSNFNPPQTIFKKSEYANTQQEIKFSHWFLPYMSDHFSLSTHPCDLVCQYAGDIYLVFHK
jgi:hypothetical protein